MTWTVDLAHPPAGDAEQLRSLLGGKGANLAIMANELGLPVPPGFVITTEACAAFLAGGWPDGLDEELRTRMAGIEQVAERGFGDPADPLLVSVRSGAPVSMPGMLDTILDLGLDDATTAGLARVAADPGFATACRQRLQTMYRDIVGTDVPDDPWAQLRGAIEAVFRSWHSERARRYREREGIDERIGTAVVVQAMVFGDRGPDSATGVLFTRDPATGEQALYGDILFGAQGEDVVAGTHATEPISVLDERLPAVAKELRRIARVLEHHHADLRDIEFTIEQGRLWMLQDRTGKRSPAAALRMAVEMAEDPDFPLGRRAAVERVADLLVEPPTVPTERAGDANVIARGLPASPGLASGSIATSADAAVRAAEAGGRVLLVRSETSPDDVHGMARSAGILTSRGGLASHAAVVARGWGIPAVVGATDVRVGDGSVTIGDRTFDEGEVLAIDGASGEVFDGPVEAGSAVVPEAAVLLGWAEELGIAIAAPAGADVPAGDADAHGPNHETPVVEADEVVRLLGIKGYVTAELLAPALGLDEAAAANALEALVTDGLATTSADMTSLTEEGKARAAALLEADRGAWGADAATAALDGFLALDARMKSVVTAWQMREVDGEQVLNDHADAAHDERVLADLAALHADAVAWLGPQLDGLPRLARYRARLDTAARKAAEGDGRWIASPRVDSYHSIWFELHEDLIRLAGRTREDEVAAGRA